MNGLIDRPKYFFFINGILTSTADMTAWNREAERWVDRNCGDAKADSYSYAVGPISRFFTQAKHVRAATQCLVEGVPPGSLVEVVGHSNGAALAVQMLADNPWISIDELHLVAAAVDADFEANGLNAAIDRGQVMRVVVYRSRDDEALRVARDTNWINRLVRGLGYGTLGLEGPRNQSRAARAYTRVEECPGFGHSTYFDAAHFEDMMRRLTHAGDAA
jgi:pimeloyl-ACP methyl ester carboxylesterase